MKLRPVFTAIGLGLGGILFAGLWGVLLAGIVWGVSGGLTYDIEIVANSVGLLFGAATIGLIYFKYSNKGMEFIDAKMPTLVQLGIGVVGLVSLLAVGLGIEQVVEFLNISSSEHQIQQLAGAEDGIALETLLIMVPISILVIGPAEEFIFRGLVQKSLYADFSNKIAIVITSLIFAVAHIFAYLTAGFGELVTSLIAVFLLSVILGWIYSYTENLAIPSLVHGFYNALIFIALYASLV